MDVDVDIDDFSRCWCNKSGSDVAGLAVVVLFKVGNFIFSVETSAANTHHRYSLSDIHSTSNFIKQQH